MYVIEITNRRWRKQGTKKMGLGSSGCDVDSKDVSPVPKSGAVTYQVQNGFSSACLCFLLLWSL